MWKFKSISAFYREVIFYVLLVLVSVAVVCAVRWYKGRPPNHVHVYDLTWPDTSDSNNVVHRRWRYYLKPRSYLPFRIEKYYKNSDDTDYVLEETLLIEYPTDEQMKAIISRL